MHDVVVNDRACISVTWFLKLSNSTLLCLSVLSSLSLAFLLFVSLSLFFRKPRSQKSRKDGKFEAKKKHESSLITKLGMFLKKQPDKL